MGFEHGVDDTGDGFWLNVCHVRPDRDQIVRGTDQIAINPRTMSVLMYLVERHGDVVSSQELFEQVWPANQVSENAVYKAINELRVAFGDSSKHSKYIETKPRKGYRLVATLRHGDGTHEKTIHVEFDSSRRLVAGVFAAALLIATFIAFELQKAPSAQATIASVADNRIAIVVPNADRSLEIASIIDVVYQETIMGIAQLPESSLESIEIPNADLGSLADEYALDHVVSINYLMDELVVQITPGTNAAPHVDRFHYYAGEANGSRLADEVVEQILADLDTVLSRAHVERMNSWGTSDLHAYRYAYEGALFGRYQNYDNLLRAADLYRRAIASDPKFVEAYSALAGKYFGLANLSPNTVGREESRQSMLALIHAARQADLSGTVIDMLDLQLAVISANHTQLAARLRAELTNNPGNALAFRRYSVMLAGAGFAEEARQYLDRAIDLLGPDNPDGSWTIYATIAVITDMEEGIRLANEIIDQFPNYTLTLFGLVENNAFLGNYIEAERHLERLVQSDDEGSWAYGAQLALAARKGDIPLHSEALANALAHPKATNMMRGTIYFTLGDVEQGISAWRNMESGLFHLLWQYQSNIETKFDQTVLDDPRYQALMNDFGLGKRWHAYLHDQTKELADITGIYPTTPVETPELNLIADWAKTSMQPLPKQTRLRNKPVRNWVGSDNS